MAFPKGFGRRIGHGIPLRRRLKRRLQKLPPAGMSLRQWRKKKDKRPTALLGRVQRPLETVAEARRQIAVIESFGFSSKRKFVALTGLLSRAYAGNQNPGAIKLIEDARDGIPLRWSAEKPLRAKEAVQQRISSGNVSEETNAYMETLQQQLEKRNFEVCNKIVHLLRTDTPKKECRIVANLLESEATFAEAKFFREPAWKSNAGFADVIMKMYSAAGGLYETKGFLDKAEEMFNAADALKARLKGL